MINYDLSKIKGIALDVDGVLSCSTISMQQNGEPMRTINIKDGYAIQLAVKRGLQLAIITGGSSDAIRKRYEGLGVQDVHMGVSVKKRIFEEWLAKRNLTQDSVLYMGDDIPDYEVMKLCGCPCCPSDAAVEIQEISLYRSPYAGGMGCCRDVIEQILRVQNLWLNDKVAFGW